VLTYQHEECAMLDQTIKVAEKVNYALTLETMQEWINKER
jgi:hypothetical protein